MEGYYDGNYIIFSAVIGFSDNTEYLLTISTPIWGGKTIDKRKNERPRFKVSVFLNSGVINICGDGAKKFLDDWKVFKAVENDPPR